MENQIIRLGTDDQFYKTMLITNDALQLTTKRKVNNIAEFQEVIDNPGMMNKSLIVPLQDIYEIQAIDDGNYVLFKYLNKSGKKKDWTVGLDTNEDAGAFTEFLGNKVGLTQKVKDTNRLMPLLSNLFYVALAAGFTVLFAYLVSLDPVTANDLPDHKVSRKTGTGLLVFGAITMFLQKYIGFYGVLAIGGFLTLYMIYLLIKDWRKPAQETHYTR